MNDESTLFAYEKKISLAVKKLRKYLNYVI